MSKLSSLNYKIDQRTKFKGRGSSCKLRSTCNERIRQVYKKAPYADKVVLKNSHHKGLQNISHK